MRISIGSDGRLPIIDDLVKSVEKRGHVVIWHGPNTLAEGFFPYPSIAKEVTNDVITGNADEAIICCFTGTGITIAANKTRGIRAALCTDSFTAKGARIWNNANVLTLSMRLTSTLILEEILDAWFGNIYVPGEDVSTDKAVKLLEELDN